MFARNILAIGLLVLGNVHPLKAAESVGQAPIRKVLLEKDMDMSGGRLHTNMVTVTLPPHYKTPLHTHEGPGPRYVLKGRVRIEEGGQSREYGVGEAFWETGTWMTAENVGEGEAEMVVVELAPAKN